MRRYDLVVIGGGSAGLASAISAYDNGVRNILLIEKEKYLGGILLQCIHSGFGLTYFNEELTGPEYAERFEKMFRERNICCKTNTTVLIVDSNKRIIYSNESEGFVEIETKSIVFAIGCKERTRGAIDIPGDRPYGILTAGLAQKYLNIDGFLIGKRVFILGSGDIGLIMARRMTLEGAKVLGVAEIMPYSNGLNRNIVQCLNDFNIPLYLSHTVTKIIGKDRIEKIELSKVDNNLMPIEGTEKIIEVDTLLLSIGLIPDMSLFGKLNLLKDSNGKLVVDENLETSVSGIFCCGNNLHVHDLVDFVTKEGERVGKSVSRYLNNCFNENEYIVVKPINAFSYIMPNRITLNSETYDFSMRVKKPLADGNIVIKIDGKIIKKLKKRNMLPSEMLHISLQKEEICNGKILTFEVEL